MAAPFKERLFKAFNFKQNIKHLLVPPSTHFQSVDGLRAFSILWVVAFHLVWLVGEMNAPEYLRLLSLSILNPIHHGHFGVDIFFVISGFLIGNMLWKEVRSKKSLDFKSFYYRRALRICPVYYFLLISVYLVAKSTNIDFPTDYVWTNFLYLNNFVPINKQFMGWSWSLCIEEQFYLICPIFILWLSTKGTRILPILLSLLSFGFIIRYIVLVQSDAPMYLVTHQAVHQENFFSFFNQVYMKPHTRFGQLLTGLIVAYLFQEKSIIGKLERSVSLAGVCLVVGIILIVGPLMEIDYVNWQSMNDNIFNASYRYLFSLGVGLLLMLCLSQSKLGPVTFLRKILSLKLFYPIAQLSYSAYLIHPIVIILILSGPAQTGNFTLVDITILTIKTFIATFSVSALLYLFIEKPMMNLR